MDSPRCQLYQHLLAIPRIPISPRALWTANLVFSLLDSSVFHLFDPGQIKRPIASCALMIAEVAVPPKMAGQQDPPDEPLSRHLFTGGNLKKLPPLHGDARWERTIFWFKRIRRAFLWRRKRGFKVATRQVCSSPQSFPLLADWSVSFSSPALKCHRREKKSQSLIPEGWFVRTSTALICSISYNETRLQGGFTDTRS